MASWWDKLASYRSEISAWWLDLDGVVRGVTLSLLFTGAVLLEIGFFADLNGVWQSYPFVVNIVSGVATACFGIPLSLAVLRHLLSQQEDRSIALRRRRTAAATAKQLSDLVDLYWINRQDLELAEKHLETVERVLAASLSLKGVSYTDGSTISDLPNAYSETLQKLLPHLRQVDRAYSNGVLPSEQLKLIEAEIVASWRYLDDHVRPQLMESGLPWIPAQLLVYSRTDPWHLSATSP